MIRFLLLLCLLCPGIAHGQEFPVRAGDLLRITVVDNPDLATDAKVSAGGRIAFPLIGEIDVAGLSALDVQGKITAMLQGRFIKHPQVAVSVVRQQVKVNVLGEFVQTGLIEVLDNATLLDVISRAGGLKPSAADTLIYTPSRRGQPESGPGEQKIEIELSLLLEGRGAVGNFTVSNGDSLYVPRASLIYVSGAVKAPGFFKITTGMTVFRAITLAGGFRARAAEGKIKIMRKGEAGEEEIKARMEDFLEPDDIVVVPESFF